MRGWFLVSVLVAFSGCTKPKDDVSVSTDKRVYIIGHAGNGFSEANEYPPNSMAAVNRAIQYYNTDGVEVDVQMSSDSVLFMCHDVILDNVSTCTGCFSLYDAATLKNCRFKSTHGMLPAEAITPVEALFQLAMGRKIKPHLFIDIHFDSTCVNKYSEAYYATMLNAVNGLMTKYNSFGYAHIESLNQEFLAYAHVHYPEIKSILDITDVAQINAVAETGIYGIGGKPDLLNAQEIAKAHGLGLKVELWGAGSKNEIVDALNSDPDYYLAEDLALVENMQ